MGTTLTGTKIKDTYKSLIKVTNNTEAGSSAKQLSDGNGNDFGVYIDTDGVLGIGGAASVAIDASSKNDAIRLPNGTTTNRASITAQAGMIRYNTTTSKFEIYDSGWKNIFTESGGTINGSVTVTGDLTVQGATTTISSETVTFEDNILLINKADAGDTPYNTVSAGIEIEKSGPNPSFIHTFSDSTWTLSDNLSVSGTLAVTGQSTFTGDVLVSGNIRSSDANGANDYIDIDNGSMRFYSDAKRMEWLASGDFNIWTTNGLNKAFAVATSGTKGTVSLFNSGTRTVLLDPNGNSYFNGGSLGIGTTSIGAKLDIHTATNSNGLLIREDTDDSITHNLYIDDSDNGSILLYADGQATKVLLNSAGNSYFNGGNLGIGVTDPDFKIELFGGSGAETYDLFRGYAWNGTANKRLDIQLDNTEADPLVIYNATRSGGSSVSHSFQVDDTEKMRIDSSGVGIGEDTPSAPLHIRKDSASGENIALILDNNNNTANSEIGLLFRSNVGSTNTEFQILTENKSANTADLIFRADSRAERMRIKSNGDVSFRNASGSSKFYWDASAASLGINTTSPASTLDVNGTIAFNSLKDSGEDITITKFVDEADTIASNNNDTTIPTSAAVDAHINSKSTTDRNNSYKIMGLAMDYLSRVHNDGGVVEGMEDVMKNTEELILA